MRAQRFISNLIPVNMFHDRLDGDDKLLPYLGQLTLLEQGEEEIWLVDSEDFTSCFNLFRLPPVWHKYMAFASRCLPRYCLASLRMIIPLTACVGVGLPGTSNRL